MNSTDELNQIIRQAAQELKARLERLSSEKGFTKEAYARFLQMQYHLTKGVQRPFYVCASHPELAQRPGLRKFLVHFAEEEELHYKIAEKDLENLGMGTGPNPLDVQLWWRYFDSVIVERPFLRLGATCILENISSESGEVLAAMMAKADFISPKTTKFLTIHQHGPDLDHGNQIVTELERADLGPQHWQDVLEGARTAKVLYLRMLDGAFRGEPAVFGRGP